MAPAAVADHLRAIVGQEGIRADDAALRMLGQAARGSMRDGLSLLDQAIAYSAGEVTLDAVRGMLGAIDTTLLIRALDAVTRRDAAGLISVADEMATRSFSFAQGLRDLASLLHRIALAQRVGGTLEDGEDGAAIVDLSQRLAPDEVQLYYQIALHGRNDLHLAPDDYAGFTMTLLRMLAFAPDAKAGEIAPMRPAALVATKPPRAAVPAPAAPPKGGVPTPASIVAARPSAAPAAVDRQADPTKAAQVRTAVPQVLAARLVEAAPATEPVPCAGEAQAPFDGDWPALVTRLPVQGLTRQLAAQAELLARDGDTFACACRPARSQMPATSSDCAWTHPVLRPPDPRQRRCRRGRRSDRRGDCRTGARRAPEARRGGHLRRPDRQEVDRQFRCTCRSRLDPPERLSCGPRSAKQGTPS
jgi:DNA polymerase III subunit gamma/tau